MRLFLALAVSGGLQKRLQDVQDELASINWQVRWTPPPSLQLTLHVLGNTPENLLEDLHHDLGALAHARRPFDLKIGGVGVFPSWDDPRIIWAAVKDRATQLETLFEASYKVLDRYRHFELQKDLSPYLRLGSVSQLSPSWDPRRIEKLLPQWDDLGTMPVEALQLMRSRVSQDSAGDETVEIYKLSAAR